MADVGVAVEKCRVGNFPPQSRIAAAVMKGEAIASCLAPIHMVASAFIRKLASFERLTDEDVALAERFEVRSLVVPRGNDIIREGDTPAGVYLIQSGLACRYTVLNNGTRHISAYLLPGDVCDLNVFVFERMDHSIGALAATQIVEFPRSAIDEMLARPRLASALFKAALVDQATLRQWLVNVARRPASEAIANLFCELHLRMAMVGLAADDAFSLPITQDELGDTIGLSTVHVNRSLADLRQRGLVTFQAGEVVIKDVAALRRFAGFQPDYLQRNEALASVSG